MTFPVSQEDDGVDVVCAVKHESLKGADRSTAQRIEVLCMSQVARSGGHRASGQ